MSSVKREKSDYGKLNSLSCAQTRSVKLGKTDKSKTSCFGFGGKAKTYEILV